MGYAFFDEQTTKCKWNIGTALYLPAESEARLLDESLMGRPPFPNGLRIDWRTVSRAMYREQSIRI